ncbi:MAG: hypothetical protein II649_10915 [Kiritimatiellae bacterium]|nr:hypothetical protein [Kiritimatiellia bacterium]
MNLHTLSLCTLCIVVVLPSILAAVPARKSSKASENEMPQEFRAGGDAMRRTSATFAPVRTTPKRQGEFTVNLVVIAFPDCVAPDSADTVRDDLSRLNGGTIAEYYKEYSQGITWPVLAAYPKIYMAPNPLGYYCRHDEHANPLGYKGDDGGRAVKLRADALRAVQSSGKGMRRDAVTCYVYCTKLSSDEEVLEKWIRPHYPPKPSQEMLEAGAKDKMRRYKPPICWADPLWPNSIPQVTHPSNGGAIVHELGHVLGAPDFYHASEERDGVPGGPCLAWAYGPTGPAFCRVTYHAFVPPAAYPKITAPGDVTLSPRSTQYPKEKDAKTPPLGVFVPSSHPNYIFCIEYCHGEKPPVGNPNAEGLLVHVINVTLRSPMLGPPDLCYTYRTDDPDCKALDGGDAFLKPGDKFDENSNPAAVLPNHIPAGIAISDIRNNGDGTCTFRLDFPQTKLKRAELDFSLLPQTEMVDLTEPLPTSFRATMNVRYRGEPLLTEYGFCYGLKKDPTEKTGKLFPLHHRDRYDARIIDLTPGVMYCVRAYARNENGIRYSSNQKGIVLPSEDTPGCTFTSTLFGPSDRLLSNWYYQRWYYGVTSDNVARSANPIFAFMALANYYRAMPAKRPPRGRDAIDFAFVHSNPSSSRPKHRMVETEKLFNAVREILKDAGLWQSDFIVKQYSENGRLLKRPSVASGKNSAFGELAPWVKKCAGALGVAEPEKTFFPCKAAEDLQRLAPEIRRWILKSQPVLVVRENLPASEEISARWPLDIAIIDGLGEDEQAFHVVFPGGKDRGTGTESGVMPLEDLLRRTTKAVVMFYRPNAKK